MKISAFQFGVTGDIRANTERVKEAIVQAAKAQVRLLVLPECALTGYPPRDISSSVMANFTLLEEAHKELQLLADYHSMYLIAGSMAKAVHGIHNTAIVFRPGQQPIHYHKRALWGWDRDNFVPGDEDGVFEIDDVQIGIRICFEVRFPEYFRELYLRKTGLNVILFYDVSDRDDLERYDLIRAHIRTRAVENVCPIITVNTIQPYQTTPTMLTNASGAILAEAKRNSEELLVVDFEPKQLNYGEQRYL